MATCLGTGERFTTQGQFHAPVSRREYSVVQLEVGGQPVTDREDRRGETRVSTDRLQPGAAALFLVPLLEVDQVLRGLAAVGADGILERLTP